MVSQPRILPRAQRTPPPLVAPALHPMQSLPRLLMVALATLLVVLIWGLQDPTAAPPAAPAPDQVAGPASSAAVGEIAAPAGATGTLATLPATDPAPAAAAVDLPRLHPNAVPRPPEPADPVQPARFDRYTVAPGDAIFNIALARGISVDDILRYNPTLGDGTRISIGDVIFIPVSASSAP